MPGNHISDPGQKGVEGAIGVDNRDDSFPAVLAWTGDGISMTVSAGGIRETGGLDATFFSITVSLHAGVWRLLTDEEHSLGADPRERIRAGIARDDPPLVYYGTCTIHTNLRFIIAPSEPEFSPDMTSFLAGGGRHAAFASRGGVAAVRPSCLSRLLMEYSVPWYTSHVR